jgi:hypothetical protein
VYLLDLKEIRPGDIILEEGDERVAAATGGGPFGHASIAIGRLLFLEADGSSGVAVSGFEPEIWSMGTRSTYAHTLAHEGVAPKVRRLKMPKPITEIHGLALGELGRDYSMDAAAKFPDLDSTSRRLLLSRMRRAPKLPGPPDAPGRACSEVVAVILGLGVTAISPNGLASHPDFVEVPAAVIDNTGGTWTCQPTGPARAEIAAAKSALRSSYAQDVHSAAQRVWASRQSVGTVPLDVPAVAAQLDRAIHASMVTSIKAMLSLDELAGNLLR